MNSETQNNKKYRILVVDDELVQRIYIEKALVSEGYEVISADNGLQAIELTEKMSPDMVVMDVMMPVVDGYMACSAIRKKEKQLHVPILMLTGLDDIESIEKSFECGATDFVVKPVNLPIFKQRIRYGLKAWESDLALYRQQQRQAHAHKVAKMGYWDLNIETNELFWSDEIYQLLAVEKDEYADNHQALLARTHREDQEKQEFALHQTLQHGVLYSLEFPIIRPDGKFQMVLAHAEPIKNKEGKITCLMGIMQDITERYLAQQKIQYQAYYDTLTGLPNRALFADRLDHALKMPGRQNSEIAVFIIDLDRFKNINDSLGHDVGDGFLKAVANNLKKATRTTDTIARLGGDEFALIAEGIKSAGDITGIAQKLLDTLAQAHYIDDNELASTGSIGVAISSKEICDRETLVKQADLAMYQAKRSGGNNFKIFTDEMKSYAHQLLVLENEIRKALERKELAVYYQPKCSVKTGKIVGMEALVRWHHPEKGLVSPLDFVSVAEETGLIVPIGQWVFEEACRQTKKWHERGFDHLVVSINISVRQFHHKNFQNDILTALDNSGIKPECVDLEITESCTMNNIDIAIQILQTFRQKGIRISMDDFGTGFSSLSYLNQLPLDILKIDRAFIKDYGKNGDQGELAKLIVAMAKTLDLGVIAEGIETREQLDFLKQSECDEFQGYLSSPPVPAERFEQLLKENLLSDSLLNKTGLS